MLRSFWRRELGGILVDEFPVVDEEQGIRPRWIDGVVLPKEEETRISPWGRRIDVSGKDVIVVQVKASPLTMSLMGQTLFSADLIEAWQPASVKAIALCTEVDARLRPLLERDGRCEVREWREGYRAGQSRRGGRTVAARPPSLPDVLAWIDRWDITPEESARAGFLSDDEMALLQREKLLAAPS